MSIFYHRALEGAIWTDSSKSKNKRYGARRRELPPLKKYIKYFPTKKAALMWLEKTGPEHAAPRIV